MRITLTGASGFLGTKLIARLEAEGHQLHLLGRRRPPSLDARHRFSPWDAMAAEAPVAALQDSGAVVHLAGEPVAQRWTAESKERMRRSRVDGTRNLVAAIGKATHRPKVLVSASAIGYYGSRGDELLTESSTPGAGFLPDLSVAWEREADAAAELGLRVVKLRIGIVLGPDGGALKQMLPPFRLGVGGRIGDGRQWMSWIDVDDIAGLILFALSKDDLKGPVNAVAPNPVRNSEFTQKLAKALHRPAIFPVPEFALKLLFGEMAEIILGSQKVEPVVAVRAGYEFRRPTIDRAFDNSLGRPEARPTSS